MVMVFSVIRDQSTLKNEKQYFKTMCIKTYITYNIITEYVFIRVPTQFLKII